MVCQHAFPPRSAGAKDEQDRAVIGGSWGWPVCLQPLRKTKGNFSLPSISFPEMPGNSQHSTGDRKDDTLSLRAAKVS